MKGDQSKAEEIYALKNLAGAQAAEIERLRAELEEANITIRALVGAPPVQEKP